MENTTHAPEEIQSLSRRELLKALGAAGGALATTAFLPGSWSKPAVEASSLPAHAMATLELSIVELFVCEMLGDFVPSFNGAKECKAVISYYDEAGMVDENARIWAWDDCGPLPIHGSAIKDLDSWVIFGDPDKGEITFFFDWERCGDICMRLAVGSRWSNTVCGPVNPCHD